MSYSTTRFIPIVLRVVKDDNLVDLVCELSDFFKGLSVKELNVDKLDELQSNVVLTLCRMEKMFPPGFFTIMVHLIVHLTRKQSLEGLFFIDRCTLLSGKTLNFTGF